MGQLLTITVAKTEAESDPRESALFLLKCRTPMCLAKMPSMIGKWPSAPGNPRSLCLRYRWGAGMQKNPIGPEQLAFLPLRRIVQASWDG